MRSLVLPLLAALAAVVGCAGYQIGNQALYPSHIHTVYVPVFESTSLRRNLGERLTEAVVKQIEQVTPLKVVGNAESADSVLRGRITSDNKRVLTPAPLGYSRLLDMSMAVEVTWADRSGHLLRDESSLPLDPAAVSVTASSMFVPEVGQSVATAQQQAIERLATQIVSLMETPW
jgi:hypothetical protein